MKKYNICLCGGGNISHALAGVLSKQGHSINILTRKPQLWNRKIITNMNNTDKKNTFVSNLNIISDNPFIALEDVDIIIVTCPIFAYDDILNNIKDYLLSNMTIICIPGRLFINYTQKHNIKNNIITILRTPYICLVEEYGKSVNINGLAHNGINYWSNFENAEIILQNLFDFTLSKLENHLSIDLVNSNLLLHSSRLYTLFHNKRVYDTEPSFYKEWCIESSLLLIKCDEELHHLINKMNENIDNKIYVKQILTHYESIDEISLTNKINSISAFTNGRTPVIFKNNKYHPDIKHRFFQEEIIALKFVLDLSTMYNIKIPNIEKMYMSFIALK